MIAERETANRMEALTMMHSAIVDGLSLGRLTCLIAQTIRQVPSRSDGIDDVCNLSSPDSSGADQFDAEHQATELAVPGSFR
jgi:hypothetical protein